MKMFYQARMMSAEGVVSWEMKKGAWCFLNEETKFLLYAGEKLFTTPAKSG